MTYAFIYDTLSIFGASPVFKNIFCITYDVINMQKCHYYLLLFCKNVAKTTIQKSNYISFQDKPSKTHIPSNHRNELRLSDQ